ncbi:PKD domain-containing protein [Algoriphagus sp. AK58]|uniref:DUF7507 domain-containing protein n=1 Tax=Algoriphagus sp. AK58 TaxID=1406877 RepID=UPI00165066BA|nr:PKD domain-containing protein [Algoriphagus sp. AK58]MBC6369223.1 hypothetical protein [Algoriphagus sp. AK58]
MDNLSNCQTSPRPNRRGPFGRVKVRMELFFILFLLIGFQSQVFSQFGGPVNFTSRVPGCPQNNALVNNVRFVKPNGDPFTLADDDLYNIGEPVDGKIFATFGGSSGNFYSIYAQYEVWVNDTLITTKVECISPRVNQPLNTPVSIGDFSWPWGSKLEIKNVYFAWQTGNGFNQDCSPGNLQSQCYFNASGIIVNTPLVANFNFQTFCENRNVSFTNLTTGGDPAVNATYSWNFGDGSPLNTTNNPTHTYASAGTYTVTLTSTKSGVIKTISKQVTVYDPIALTINAPPAVCSPGTVDLTLPAVTNGSSSGLTFTYWTDNLATQPLANPSAVSISGTYYIKGVNPITGCQLIRPVVVTINPLPDFSVIPPAAVCSPNTINLTTTHTAAQGATFSYWLDSEATQPVPNPLAVASSGTYYIKATSSSGCFVVKSVTVSIGTCAIRLVKEFTNTLSEDECLDPTLNPVINYTFTATLGSQSFPLSNVSITDPKVPTITYQSGDTNTNGILESGESWVYTGSYTILASDIEAGQVTNQATARGSFNGYQVSDLSGTTVDNDLQTVTPICQNAVIEIIKVSNKNPLQGEDCVDLEVGETITYTFTVTNKGNTQLINVAVVEESFSGAGAMSAISFVSSTMGSAAGTLKVGEVATYTATYVVQQGDINNGLISNQAKATATGAGKNIFDLSSPSTSTPEGVTEVVICQDFDYSITKVATPQTYDSVGEEISYDITVTNDGNVTLKGIVVTDPLTGLNQVIASLAPQADTVIVTK